MKTTKFKFILFAMIIVSIYCSVTFAKTPYGFLEYIPALLVIFTHKNFIVFTLIMLLISNMFIYDLTNNRNYVIRFINKKEYIDSIIKNTILFSGIILFIQILLIFFISAIFCHDGLGFYNLKTYNVNSAIYLIFIVIKYMFFVQCFSIINILMLSLFNRSIVTLGSVLYCVNIIFGGTDFFSKSIKWHLIDYLVPQLNSSFILFFLHSVTYGFVVLIFIQYLRKIVVKFVKTVGK